MKYLFIEQIQYESLHLDLLQYNTSDKNLINFNVLFADVESPSDLKSHFSLPYYRGKSDYINSRILCKNIIQYYRNNIIV